MKLTQERLKEILSYDPETGIFTWLISRGRSAKAGRIAGTTNKTDKHRYIGVDGKRYAASRLAWLYVEGYFPEHDIDHRNRISDDDKWENLRHVSHLCNMRNLSTNKNNKSGIAGVYWSRERKKWVAQISVLNKILGLGRFNSKIDAAKARWNAEVKYGFPDCNTTSTAYLYLQGKEV